MVHSDDLRSLASLCDRIAAGKRLARQLAVALREHGLSETEFRLLWLLDKRGTATQSAEIEQRQLPADLGVSAGQISAVVERLRSLSLIANVPCRQDRRRQRWALTAGGSRRVAGIALGIARPAEAWLDLESNDSDRAPGVGDAA
ncbi:MAG: hypothetical protein AAGD11_04350 [Planctomycetota bacterium]